MSKITPKEQKVLDIIADMNNWRPPSIREVSRMMNLKSDGFVFHCINSLIKKGVLFKTNDDLPYYLPIWMKGKKGSSTKIG